MQELKPVRRNILLNPGPATTSDTVKYAQVVPDICPREKEFVQTMAGVRRQLIEVVHADADKFSAVLFSGTGTMAQDVCVNSLVPANKKICIVNNGAYSTRMVEIAKAYGIPHVDLQFPPTTLPDLDEVQRALQTDRDIVAVATTHHETGTGILNPIREIGALARENGCVFVVDTISTFGLIPFRLEDEYIDFCMASAQKGLAGITGVSWVVGNIAEIRKSKDYPLRSYYCNLYRQYDYFERVGEMQFTPPVQTIYALKQAIAEHWQEGEQAKYDRLTQCWQAIHAGLEELGLTSVIDKQIQSRLVVTVRAPQDERFDFNRLHDFCYERGFTIYPGKMFGLDTFRLCNLGQITQQDIKDFFKVAKQAFEEMGISIPLKK